MQASKKEQQVMIRFLETEGIGGREMHRQMKAVYDDARTGQGPRVITPRMTVEVNALVLDNHRIIVDEIHRLMGIRKIPEGSKLANMVTNAAKMIAKVAKLAANLVSKNDANLALQPRFRQVLIESPL
ncbi:histone-lysine N-methyltransferase SETMAR [Trichonephila clavipes]|nr:histone-lysine N-methyltransferase SETMAR [Trichonephila clavipes]